MVKAEKFFRKQALKAQRAARAPEERSSGQLSNLADAFLAQAEVLRKKKNGAKRRKK
jgi:hypothetical protein